MGEKTEQPDEYRPRYPTAVPEPDQTDVAGHKKVAKVTDDEPGPSEAKKKFTESDEDDVEGHRVAKS